MRVDELETTVRQQISMSFLFFDKKLFDPLNHLEHEGGRIGNKGEAAIIKVILIL